MKTEERSAPSCTTKTKGCRAGLQSGAQSAPSVRGGVRPDGTHCPEFDEVLQHGGGDEQAVHQRVGQEEDEELVVGEAHAVVDPGGGGRAKRGQDETSRPRRARVAWAMSRRRRDGTYQGQWWSIFSTHLQHADKG